MLAAVSKCKVCVGLLGQLWLVVEVLCNTAGVALNDAKGIHYTLEQI